MLVNVQIPFFKTSEMSSSGHHVAKLQNPIGDRSGLDINASAAGAVVLHAGSWDQRLAEFADRHRAGDHLEVRTEVAVSYCVP